MKIGEVTNKASAFEAEIRVIDDRVRIGQFVKAKLNNHYVLCKLTYLQYKPQPKSRGGKVIYLGKISPVTFVPKPLKPGTEVFTANADLIRKTLGLKECSRKITFAKLLNTKVDVCIDPQGLLQHLAIMGKTGLGKTYTGEVLLEQLLLKGYTSIIVDPHDDFLVLAEVPEFEGKVKIFRMKRELPTLSDLYHEGCCTIIPMKDFDDEDWRERVMHYLTTLLFDNVKAGNINPFFFVIDESHILAPQDHKNFCKESIIKAVKEGRKFGMGVILLTQRPASLDKNALSQCGTQIILKVTNDNDIKSISRSVEGMTVEDKKMIQKLDTGEALVMGIGLKTPIYVKVNQKMSPDKKKEIFGIGGI